MVKRSKELMVVVEHDEECEDSSLQSSCSQRSHNSENSQKEEISSDNKQIDDCRPVSDYISDQECDDPELPFCRESEEVKMSQGLVEVLTGRAPPRFEKLIE